MAWNDLLANQMVSFTDAQGSGFDLKSGQSEVTSDKIMTKSDILTKYDIASDNFNAYANNQLVPKNSWNADIIIGTQTWKAQNLNVETYRDGTPLQNGNGLTALEWANLTVGAWCWYGNSSTNGEIYGKLYNWYAVAGLDGSGTPRNLAPIGYHVPTPGEWTTLTNFLGGPSTAGGRLKNAGTTYWNSPNNVSTPYSGFNALPAGKRTSGSPQFVDLGNLGYWWSSLSTDRARYIYNNTTTLIVQDLAEWLGFSVRLIKD
jgi:uncharacterized protein (TIGR02145 family)